LVGGLLAVMWLQMGLSIRRISQTWDEGAHIFAGYSYWQSGDFGVNPEHPPLLKMLATLPILNLPLRAPDLRGQHPFFKIEEFVGARYFMAWNDPEKILFRTRMMASVLTLLLGLLIFAVGREMYGVAAGLFALAFFAFEPNFLAHGALVTTDVGLTLFMFAAVYAYYRYKKEPSALGLLLVGVTTGLAFASKHSGVLLVPMLLTLALVEIVRVAREKSVLLKPLLQTFGEALAVAAIAVAILWAAYGFHYSARPKGMAMTPPLANQIDHLHSPYDIVILTALSQHHLLPEAYLYGLTDVRNMADTGHTYIFGQVYGHRVWYYFPAAFLIKSTLPILVLLMLVPIALTFGWLRLSRESLYLAVPTIVYVTEAIRSGLNLGIRHLLPVFPFLLIAVGATAAAAIARDRRWAYAVSALLLVHVVSSARTFPNYLAYSNEAWGGPSKTYKYLTDSNVDWAQQLKQAHQYLVQHQVKDCWIAYFAEAIVDRDSYGVGCKGLPTATARLDEAPEVPEAIDGTVLISASTLSGYEFLPDEPNPYAGFANVKPVAQIGDGMFVYQGHFEVPLASALAHARRAEMMLAENRVAEALQEAQIAQQLAPSSLEVRAAMSQASFRANHPEGR
jgi:Dolichyl-phosphate-mannose-protein mannosyltransferase